ncbi:hypothetical protein [Bacillus pinisoli]|uniref:hypothetical protein n=1 Tax=Bacillus pinisoli TaxID=2901866 RepID=UPI001FF571B2|nr:hypothetical protein [Bacillus pinisoli]
MSKKWLMLLTSSLLAAFLMTGCAVDDQDPAPPGEEDNGMETETELENDIEDAIPGGEGNGADEMTPADETTPGDNEMEEGTPGEEDEGLMEDPEENMEEGTENGMGTEEENK